MVFARCYLRLHGMEKWPQRVQWAAPGAINRHSDHISTVTPPQTELWMYVISGPTKNPRPSLKSCLTRGEQRESRLRDFIKSRYPSQKKGQAFQKAFIFIRPLTFITCVHVRRASHVLCSMPRHTFTLQSAVSTLKTELRTKGQV